MVTLGLVLAALGALVHLYIFWMESFAWTSARVRATFGLDEQAAETTREMAFNQGFYNLFLALLVLVGAVLALAGHRDVGATLVLAGAGSMVGAGLVLVLRAPGKARAALVQLGPPALGVIALVVGLLA